MNIYMAQFINSLGFITDKTSTKWQRRSIFIGMLILADAVLCYIVIKHVPYTEIDWVAYMQEVEGWLGGETNYEKLKGDTGPLVYPAFFLYLYSGIRWLTDEGRNIRVGQWLFGLIYLINLGVVLAMYEVYAYEDESCNDDAPPAIATNDKGCLRAIVDEEVEVDIKKLPIGSASLRKRSVRPKHRSRSRRSRLAPRAQETEANVADKSRMLCTSASDATGFNSVPWWGCVLLVLSKRVHSIFMLRMFNDTIAAFLGYVAILLFMQRKLRVGCFVYSLGVGTKMNLLLFAPGVLLVLLLAAGWRESLLCLSICAATQLAIGYPFLSTYPLQYLKKAFELSRVFMYKWTVNFKFLEESVFLSKGLSVALLLLTLGGMVTMYIKWLSENSAAARDKGRGPSYLHSLLQHGLQHDLSPRFVVVTIFTSNFIGIAFSRTIHYQFYCWYYHMLPLLLWHCRFPSWLVVCICLCVEVAYNVYPATAWSSLLLQAAHLSILVGLWTAPAPRIWKSKL